MSTARLTLEPVAEAFVRLLDGDRAVQARVAGLVDLAHPAGANRPDDPRCGAASPDGTEREG
jgi:hypothetical protein